MDQQWDELVKHFCSVSDRLGMPIDDEIFDTVVVLNALGITTTMSCAGHITRDQGDVRYPWIDFSTSTPTIDELRQRQIKRREQAETRQKKLTRLRQKHPTHERLASLTKKSRQTWNTYHEAEHHLRKLQVPMRQQMITYLVQFYEHRQVPFDQRLTLRLLGSKTRLESQGAADFYVCEPREIQRQKLAEYRSEMHDFTAFLIAIYRDLHPEDDQPPSASPHS